MSDRTLPVLEPGDLDAELAELLPHRETLCQLACPNVVTVVGVNLSIAVNAATVNSSAHALAQQYLSAAQVR
jgi:hypothetical protein